MALDSYRCLAEGVLDQPIDGDIGSIMGVGYAAHTGGTIAHIDQVGLTAFIQDCDSFNGYGEQWNIPDSLRVLAKQGYTFYDGFNSNWPRAK
jgi:3-hydroxyacyl-CoA dehydrogenase/enoyl-CoA hydratase/3-hydroxybutyryl-CoA epimerase